MSVGYARTGIAAVLFILCACGQSTNIVEPSDPAELAWRTGNAALEQRQFEQAVVQYDAAIAANPQFTLAYLSRGNAYLGLSNYDAAISDYGNALAIDGALAEALRARGELYWSIGDNANAEQDFAALVQLRPDDSADANRYAFVLYELGRHGELEQFYRNAYRADHRRDWALLGWLTSVEQSRGVAAMQEQSLQLYNSGDQSLMVRYS
jgi:tetratricopeptide (TPR) repeat protein